MSAVARSSAVLEAARAGAGSRETEERGPEVERRYSWIEGYLARLDGKEARDAYYAWLTSGNGP